MTTILTKWYKVYTRRNLADTWVYQEAMQVGRVSVHAGPKVGTAELLWVYDKAHPAPTLDGYWVYIALVDPTTAAESDIFLGIIPFGQREIGRMRVVYPAVDLKIFLANITLSRDYGEKTSTTPTAQRIAPQVYNYGMLADAMPRGYRSQYEYDLTTRAKWGGSESYTPPNSYIFGQYGAWTCKMIVNYLIANYLHDTSYSPIPFHYTLDTAAASLASGLASVQAEFDLTGNPLNEALNTVIRKAGDFSWSVRWTVGRNEAYIDIWTKDQPTADAETHNITWDDVETAKGVVLGNEQQNKVNRVIAYGGRRKYMFTVDWDTLGDPYYTRGWDPSLETAWGLADEKGKEASQFAHVWTRYRLRVNNHNNNWDRVFKSPNETLFGSPQNLLQTNAAPYYNHNWDLLPHLLVYDDYTYTSQAGASPLSKSALGANSIPTFKSLRGWFLPDVTTEPPVLIQHVTEATAHETRYYEREHQGRMERGSVTVNYLAVRIPRNIAVDKLRLDTDNRFGNLIFTLAVEADERLSYEVGATPGENDTNDIRVVTIEHPECEWWAAVNAVVDVASNATLANVLAGVNCTVIHGVLRDDSARLGILATQAYTRFNAAKMRGTFPLNDCDLTFTLGEFIGTYTDVDDALYTVNTPIMSITYELATARQYGMTLQTLFAEGD